RAQAPRLPAVPARWIAQFSASSVTVGPTSAHFPILSSRDAAAIRRTHWLEGGLIGGVLVGLLGSQLCNLGDETPPARCYVEAFALTAVGIGFPAGGLIGSQFPKHIAPSGEPPPQ